jgi:glycerol-3-phosphate acyltransferase PlsX
MQTAGEEGEYNFVGNIEASHLFTAEVADVVVCDGFVGNVILKLMEGLYTINRNCGTTNSFWEGMDYEVRGGSPILGIDAPVVIGHGRSTATAICNMILTTERHAR